MAFAVFLLYLIGMEVQYIILILSHHRTFGGWRRMCNRRVDVLYSRVLIVEFPFGAGWSTGSLYSIVVYKCLLSGDG